MEESTYKSLSHAVYALRLHVIFVTKYRRPALSEEMREYLRGVFQEIAKAWRCKVLEYGAEVDHVHLLLEIHPALQLSVLANNLKSASSKRLRRKYKEELSKHYWKPVLWHRAYFMSTVGTVSLEVAKQYIAKQGTTEKPRRG